MTVINPTTERPKKKERRREHQPEDKNAEGKLNNDFKWFSLKTWSRRPTWAAEGWDISRPPEAEELITRRRLPEGRDCEVTRQGGETRETRCKE